LLGGLSGGERLANRPLLAFQIADGSARFGELRLD
jgi:hypothetical protein